MNSPSQEPDILASGTIELPSSANLGTNGGVDAGGLKPPLSSPLPSRLSLDERLRAKRLAPHAARVMSTLEVMSLSRGEDLARVIYESLFGNPAAAGHAVMLWFRTCALGHPRSQPPPQHQQQPQQNPGADPVAALLRYLAKARAAPCVVDHRVGGRERHLVRLFPFGLGDAMARDLWLPITHLDVRLVRALQLLCNNPWAFRDLTQDPTFGFFTYGCFAYTDTAQQALDQCRPVLLAAAVRAVVAELRIELARTDFPNQPHAALTRQVLARAPTRTRAVLEHCMTAAVRSHATTTTTTAGDAPSARHSRLLADAFRFVLDEAPMMESLADAETGSGPIPLPVLPTDNEIRQYADQVAQRWAP